MPIVTWARSGTGSPVLPQALDEGEYVVPASAIEPDDVVPQLIKDFVHLEGGRQRLDQYRRFDGPNWQAERLLRDDENIVPQPRLEMALEFRQIEVRAVPAALAPWRCGRVEAEIHSDARHLSHVHMDVRSIRCQPRGRTISTAGLGPSGVSLAVRRDR